MKRKRATVDYRRLAYNGRYEYSGIKPGGNGGAQWHPYRIRIRRR